MDMSTTPEEIGRMYDEAGPISKAFNDGQEHLSYWYGDDDPTPLTEAAQRLTRKVVETLGLRAGAEVLDAGCGLGAASLLVAEEFGVRLTGVTVSGVQVAEARRRAQERGLADRVRFQYGDFMALPLQDSSFDAVMAIESLMHAPDLARVLAEFHRVLRPGGALAFSDYTLQEAMSPQEAELYAATYKANRPLSMGEWRTAVHHGGFAIEEYTECGPRVYGMGPRHLAKANAMRAELTASFGAEAADGLREGLRSHFAPGGRRIGYVIMTARRPRI